MLNGNALSKVASYIPSNLGHDCRVMWIDYNLYVNFSSVSISITVDWRFMYTFTVVDKKWDCLFVVLWFGGFLHYFIDCIVVAEVRCRWKYCWHLNSFTYFTVVFATSNFAPLQYLILMLKSTKHREVATKHTINPVMLYFMVQYELKILGFEDLVVGKLHAPWNDCIGKC